LVLRHGTAQGGRNSRTRHGFRSCKAAVSGSFASSRTGWLTARLEGCCAITLTRCSATSFIKPKRPSESQRSGKISPSQDRACQCHRPSRRRADACAWPADKARLRPRRGCKGSHLGASERRPNDLAGPPQPFAGPSPPGSRVVPADRAAGQAAGFKGKRWQLLCLVQLRLRCSMRTFMSVLINADCRQLLYCRYQFGTN
jgi:hypothetical protein